MKKLFKLFLCLVMLISFTNVTFALGEEEFISINDVKERFNETNFMQAMLLELREEDPDIEINVNIDSANHKLNLVAGDETLISFNYTDEYISYLPEIPDDIKDYDPMGQLVDFIYAQNIMYSVLDAMGYQDKDLEVDAVTDEDFFDEYGLLMTEEEYEYDDDDGGHVSGTLIREIRVSLSREKIAKAVSTYGIKRPDYISIASGKVVKPEISIKKKGSALIIRWEEDPNAVLYKIYRSDKIDGTYRKIATVNTDSAYRDKNVAYGKRYYYIVRAVGNKNAISSDAKGFKMVPEQVKNLKITSVGTNAIKMRYDQVSETGYVIERSTNNKDWSVVKTVTKNTTLTFKNTGLKANKLYYYRVRAYKQVGNSKVYGAYSNVVSYRTAPDAPVIKAKVGTYDSLRITHAETTGASKYIIYRSTKKDGTYKRVGEVTTESFRDEGLTFGQVYYYKAQACNRFNTCGNYSAIVGRKVEIAKPGIALKSNTTTPMTITVTNVANTKGYVIYRATSQNGTYSKLATLDSGTSTYVDETAKKNTTYYYKVRSYVYIDGARAYSVYSDIKSLKCTYTKPAQPPVQTIAAKQASDFNGVYTKGAAILKIFAKAEDNVRAILDGDSYGDYSFDYDNGKLTNEFFSSTLKIQLTEKGVLFSGGSSSENGEYTKESDYTFDEYFSDRMGNGEFMNTRYNGLFRSADGEEAFLFQSEENTLLFAMDLENDFVSIDMEIGDTMATGEIFEDTYEVEESTGILTVRYNENGVLKYEKTFNRIQDLTREQILEHFDY